FWRRLAPPSGVLSRAHIYGYGRSLRPCLATPVTRQKCETITGRGTSAPGAAALQRDARDPDDRRHRLRVATDDGDSGAAGAPARAPYDDHLGDLGTDDPPARRIGFHSNPRQAR